MTNRENDPCGAELPHTVVLADVLEYCDMRTATYRELTAAAMDRESLYVEMIQAWAQESILWAERARIVEAVLDAALDALCVGP